MVSVTNVGIATLVVGVGTIASHKRYSATMEDYLATRSRLEVEVALAYDEAGKLRSLWWILIHLLRLLRP